MHGSWLEWYDLAFRTHDPQIGRFLQVDPLADKYVYNSTYAYAENKVINGIDLEGLEWWGLPLLGNSTTITRSPVIENVVKPGVEVGAKVGRTTSKTANKAPKVEDHHGIPRQFKDHPVVKSGREGGFKFEGKENKIPVEKFDKSTGKGQHGNHPNFNKEIGRRLADFKEKNLNASNTVKEMKETIQSNPDTKINDLFKSNLPPMAKDGIIRDYLSQGL